MSPRPHFPSQNFPSSSTQKYIPPGHTRPRLIYTIQVLFEISALYFAHTTLSLYTFPPYRKQSVYCTSHLSLSHVLFLHDITIIFQIGLQ